MTQRATQQVSSVHHWWYDTFHQPIHHRYIFLFKHGVVWRWSRITCIISLLIRAEGTTILYLLFHWSSSHGRERCNHKRPLCIRTLLNNHPIRLKSRWLASPLLLTLGTKRAEIYCFLKGADALGLSTSTKRQVHVLSKKMCHWTVWPYRADGPWWRRRWSAHGQN
jgi:hypothetical protein